MRLIRVWFPFVESQRQMIYENQQGKQIDYTMAFPQAPIERPLYMHIPKGYTINEGNPKDYALKLKKNLYGQKQAGQVWNEYLVSKLFEIGFQQSKFNERIFYKKDIIYLLYTDGSIIMGPDRKEIDNTIKDIQHSG